MEKRLKMIEDRISEIAKEYEKRNLTAEEVNSFKEEVKELRKEEQELRNKIELSKQLEDSAEIIEKGEKRNMNYTVDSKEYRSAFLKELMGKKLNEAEERALTSVSGSAGAAIPTQTMNQIIDKLAQTSVLFDKVSVSYIAGNVSFVVANAKNDASFKAEGADETAKDDTVTTVSLTGHELIKLVEMSAKVSVMSIDTFESYIVAEIGRKMAIAIENAILNGTGIDQPTGLLHSGKITNTGEFTNAGMTYKDLVGMLAKLPTMYHKNAVAIMPRELFFNEVIGMTTDQGEPVVVQNPQAPMQFNVLGYPVVIDDYMPKDTIVFGDLKYYKLNFAQNPTIESDKSAGFKSGKTIYRGLAIVDGKPALSEAFVKYTRAS